MMPSPSDAPVVNDNEVTFGDNRFEIDRYKDGSVRVKFMSLMHGNYANVWSPEQASAVVRLLHE